MKVGVIGTGNMGEKHALTYLSLSEHCQLVGIYDNDQEKAHQLAIKYNILTYSTITALLKEVDAVSIAVPTKYHFDIGLMCIKHKVHILMEKPMTSTVTQAKILHEKANVAGIKFQVGHIELFNPLIHTLKKEMTNHEVLAIDIHRMSPYNEKLKNIDVVQDLMIHDVYLLKELINDEITDFYTVGKIIEHTPKHATVIAKSLNGIVAHLTASFKSTKKIRSIKIFEENALIEADLLKNEIQTIRAIKELNDPHPKIVSEKITIPSNSQPLRNQLLDFITCIKENHHPTVSSKDGIHALTISNKISEAIYNQSTE